MSTDYSEVDDVELDLFEVSEKDIYKFSSDFPKNTNQGIPNHYHICAKISDKYLIFNCCTSQSGKVKDRIKFLGRTYVEVTNYKISNFKEQTFIDCDTVFTMSKQSFRSDHEILRFAKNAVPLGQKTYDYGSRNAECRLRIDGRQVHERMGWV